MRLRALLVAAGLVLILAGCSQAGSGTASGPVAEQSPSMSARSVASAAPSTVPPTPSESVSLPPGDPGLDASSVPDPGVPSGTEEAHEERPRKSVPARSMLGSRTVSGVLGGSWQEAPAVPEDCPLVKAAVARRTVVYRSDGGEVVQTVTTQKDAGAADRAVRKATEQLRSCGWEVLADPRLGSASTAAEQADSGRSAIVVASEGVTVTLVGSGAATASRPRWSSLADIALGNACAAAPDGCH